MSQENSLATNQKTSRPRYDHASHETTRRFLRFLIRVIGFNFLAKLASVEGLENIPASGPAILMMNHLAFVDSLTVLHVCPRQIVPMAKIEVYDYPGIGIFPHLWGVIPVRREEFDRRALQGALDVLEAGEMILIAPEATRSTQLHEGKEGVAYLAHRANVPVVPVGIDGSPGFPAFRTSARWKGPGISIRFGRPFRYHHAPGRLDRLQMRQMTNEAMYILASLLPEHRRGYYSDLSKATQETLELL
jgi:1-acyl-sn-glycerol-3-phosphate acyltransferase